MKKELVDHTCNGKCSRCGECCGLFIPFTEKELSIIRKYVKDYNITPTNRFITDGMESYCCFFNKKQHKCTIYEVRPYTCRDFKCNHKDWLKIRNHYEKIAKYNSTLTKKFIIGTFDDLIYEDYRYILQYFISTCYDSNTKSINSEKLVNLLTSCNRLDLLQYITAYDENGNKIKGTDLNKI